MVSLVIVVSKMIVRIQVLKNNKIDHPWSLFVVEETRTLKSMFTSIKSGNALLESLEGL